jgi:hypothetical protein
MKCQNCGADNISSARFCKHCGSELGNSHSNGERPMKINHLVSWLITHKIIAGIILLLGAIIVIYGVKQADSSKYSVSLVYAKDRGQVLEAKGIGNPPWGTQTTKGRFVEVAVNVKNKKDPNYSSSNINSYNFSVTGGDGKVFEMEPILDPWKTKDEADVDMLFDIPTGSKNLKLNFSTSYYDRNLRKINEKKIIDLGL